MVVTHQWLSYNVLSQHIMPIYPIARIQLSFVQSSILRYEFSYFIKSRMYSIYYHFRRDHENSGFRKLAINKWICKKNCDYFLDQFIVIKSKNVVQKPISHKQPLRVLPTKSNSLKIYDKHLYRILLKAKNALQQRHFPRYFVKY